MQLRCALALSLVLFGFFSGAQAQGERPSRGALLPPTSVAAGGGAYVLEANPGNLALMPTWEVALSHGQRPDVQSNGLYAATPLPFGLGIGAHVDWLRGARQGGRFGLALGYRRGRHLGAGVALRFVRAPGQDIDGLVSFDVGVSWRPTSFFALGITAHDLLAPVGLTGGGTTDLGTFGLSAQLRPFSNDALLFEVGAQGNTDGQVFLRGLAGLAVPKVGRLTAQVQSGDVRADGGVSVQVGLQVDWGRVRAEGGLASAHANGRGGWAGVRLRGAPRDGLPGVGAAPEPLEASYVDDVRLSALGARGVLAVVARLDRDLRDDRVKGVLLRFRSSGIGSAYAQELRMAIAALRDAGKEVLCHLEGASAAEFYVCSAATQRFIDPAGSVRLLGPSATMLHYGEALERLGVRTDFVRIGGDKSAPEVYGAAAPTERGAAQMQRRIDGVYERMLVDLGRDREENPEAIEGWFGRGLFSSVQAEAEGLVDGALDEHELGEVLREHFGAHRRGPAPRRITGDIGIARRIAVLVVDGTMVDGDNTDIPLLEIHNSGGRTISRALEALAGDPTVAAIVLRIDSPGGAVMASDQIWRAVRRARERKPVIASMGAMAASGGYYIASAADEIWANPTTLTGSIGIFFGKVDFAGLAERLGVGLRQYRRGPFAGAESLFRPFSAAERAGVADAIRGWYGLFLRRVAEGRGMNVEAVHAVGQGAVFTGDEAVGNGLVDRLGGFQSALRRARERSGLGEDAQIVMLPGRPSSLLDYVVGDIGLRAFAGASERSVEEAQDTDGALPPALRWVAGAVQLLATENGAAVALGPVAPLP